MGDPRRFHLFADAVERRVPDHGARIADVAAGKGVLSFELRRRGYRNVVPFEPRPRPGGQFRRLGMRVREFSSAIATDFDVLLGLHPDEATDHILDAAATTGATAIVCPCCVRPSAWTYWGNRGSTRNWVEHLVSQSARRGLRLEESRLKMNGANVLLVGNARW